jgi:hypothetical protein
MLRIIIAERGSREIGRFPVDIHPSFAPQRPLYEQDFYEAVEWLLLNSGFTAATVGEMSYRPAD